MKFSITAVSGNRNFTKALVRHSAEIDSLRNAAVGYSSSSLPFDTLQIVFLDRDQSYFRAVGCKKDRLFQVEMATPDEKKTEYSSGRSLLCAIAEKMVLAIEITNIADKEKKALISLIKAVERQQP